MGEIRCGYSDRRSRHMNYALPGVRKIVFFLFFSRISHFTPFLSRHSHHSLARAMASDTVFVVPGDKMPANTAADSSSTFMWDGALRASVSGKISARIGDGSSSMQASRKRSAAASSILSVGDTVVGRVTRITPRLAHVDILSVGVDAPLRDTCAGLLRREDVRPAEHRTAEMLEMHRCVRPGDVILATVLSLGDSRAYFLSTSANEHGVVIAKSLEGAMMKPVSYCEMECPVSLVREKRKVAKPPERALGSKH